MSTCFVGDGDECPRPSVNPHPRVVPLNRFQVLRSFRQLVPHRVPNSRVRDPRRDRPRFKTQTVNDGHGVKGVENRKTTSDLFNNTHRHYLLCLRPCNIHDIGIVVTSTIYGQLMYLFFVTKSSQKLVGTHCHRFQIWYTPCHTVDLPCRIRFRAG